MTPSGRWHRFWKRRFVRVIAICIIALLVLLAAISGYFRIYSPDDVVAYYCMPSECNPIWKDLALRLIRKDDPVEKAIHLSQPSTIVTCGPYSLLIYNENYLDAPWGIPFTGLSIIAKNDRLIYASAFSCTWRHVFFGDEQELQPIDEFRYLPHVVTRFSRDGKEKRLSIRPPQQD